MRAGAAADPLVQDVLAHLRGLAAARVAAHQRHGVLVDGLQDLGAEGEHRQLLAHLSGGLQLGVRLLALGPVRVEVLADGVEAGGGQGALVIVGPEPRVPVLLRWRLSEACWAVVGPRSWRPAADSAAQLPGSLVPAVVRHADHWRVQGLQAGLQLGHQLGAQSNLVSGHLIQAYILLQRARESLDDPMVEELADQGEVGVGVPVLRIGYALHVMLLEEVHLNVHPPGPAPDQLGLLYLDDSSSIHYVAVYRFVCRPLFSLSEIKYYLYNNKVETTCRCKV